VAPFDKVRASYRKKFKGKVIKGGASQGGGLKDGTHSAGGGGKRCKKASGKKKFRKNFFGEGSVPRSF